MLREEQVRLLRGLISHLDAGTNVDAKGIVENPADTYTCLLYTSPSPRD